MYSVNMTRKQAIEYVGHHVDDALSTDLKPITDKTRLVGWQCGFEPMFVAVHSYLNCVICDDEAEELAIDLLEEIGWFSGETKSPDFIY